MWTRIRLGQALAWALAFLLLAGRLPVALAAPPDPVSRTKAAAQKIYLQGTSHYKAGRMLEALAAFRASYEMVPSANSHLMIARTLRESGDLAQAYVEYKSVVTEAERAAQTESKYAGAAQASQVERDELRGRLTLLTVLVKNATSDLRIFLGERALDRSDWGSPVPVMSGPIVARGVASERPEQRRELVASPGGELVVSFDFAPVIAEESILPSPFPSEAPPRPAHGADASAEPRVDAPPDIPRQPARLPDPTPDRTWAYVSLGAGAVGFATFAVFGVLNQATYDDLKEGCPYGHCSRNRSDDIDKGRREQLIANVGLSVSVVATTLGVVLLMSGGESEHRPEEKADRGRSTVVTDIRLGPSSLLLRGEF